MSNATQTTKPNPSALTIGIVAGEISGDTLGADFMATMNTLHPSITWVGVGGDKMTAQGLHSIMDMARLSVMGLAEIVSHLPDLFLAKREILHTLTKAKIDIFIGIDAPDFNLRLGKILKAQGVFCVQYVSPSIWAWREHRIHSIKSATHLVLCLFPFELPVYAKHNHLAVCVGHPLIRQLNPLDIHHKNQLKNKYLSIINQSTAQPIICLMSGSRLSEIRTILPILLRAFAKLIKIHPHAYGLLPLAKDEHIPLVQSLIDQTTPHLSTKLHLLAPHQVINQKDSPAQLAISLADITLIASGTATLECMLIGTPMVVVYKVNAITFALAKRLIKTPFVALPNILQHHIKPSGAIVPELLQDNATATKIANTAHTILAQPKAQQNALICLTHTLKSQSEQNAAQAVYHAYQAHQNTHQ